MNKIHSATLTIDTEHLRDVWLPAEKKEYDTATTLWNLGLGKVTDVVREALIHGHCLAQYELKRTVDEIVKRGGLLLIGGAA